MNVLPLPGIEPRLFEYQPVASAVTILTELCTDVTQSTVIFDLPRHLRLSGGKCKVYGLLAYDTVWFRVNLPIVRKYAFFYTTLQGITPQIAVVFILSLFLVSSA